VTKKYNKNSVKKNYQLLLMVFVAMVFVFIFAYIPMYGVIIAFQDFSPAFGYIGSPWVGLEHFNRFFNNYRFWTLLDNTFSLSFFGFLIGFPLPIILALLLNAMNGEKFKKIFQTIFYAPHFISVVVLTGMLYLFFGEYGLVNNLLQTFNLEKVSFFLDAFWFRPLFIGSGNWQSTGWSAIIYLAALSGVDPQLHESAMMDGASRFKRILHIDFPAIFPTISIILILSIGNMMSVGFEKVLLLQTGTNLSASEIISTYVYKTGILDYEYSYAAAIGLFNSIINVILLIIANTTARRFSENSLW
jgi:putative aldouronate transport system permease protein